MATLRKKLLSAGKVYSLRGSLLKTRQTTVYHVGDDGDYEVGLSASYTVLDTGQFAGTTAIDTPHYAAATLAFVSATKKITDSANGLVTFLTGDTIRVRGSTGNDGVYTVATGGNAAEIVTTEALADELAGAYITLCKRSTPSNNLVQDNITGLMWKRSTTGTIGSVEKVGAASTGLLNWYDTATCFTIHPAAGDLQMMVDRIKIVGGAGEIARYFAGMIIDPSGFANAVNNMPGYRVTSVAVNGADLDILLWTGTNVLVAEAAAGARDIRVVCRSIYAYCGAAIAAGFSGYTDWRIPNANELHCLEDFEAASAIPDAVAFPNWSTTLNIWSSTVTPPASTWALWAVSGFGGTASGAQTNVCCCELVRGGTS